MQPLISLIIPIYNVEKYLKECLQSALIQTYENIEILCIYDINSTDNSYDVLKKFKDSRIKIIENSNKGAGNSRNLGLKNAKGEYICFLDSDDWLDPRCIEIMYEEMISGNYDLVFTGICCYNNKTSEFFYDPYYTHSNFFNNSYEVDTLFKEYKDLDVSPVSKLYKMEIIKKNNTFYPENIMFEDNIFFFDYLLSCKSKIKFNNLLLYFYRQKNCKSLTNSNNKFIDIFAIMDLLTEVFKKHKVLKKYELYLQKYINDSIDYWTVGREKNTITSLEYCNKISEWVKENKYQPGNNEIVKYSKKPKGLYKYLYRNQILNPLIKDFLQIPLIQIFIINPLKLIISFFDILLRFILSFIRIMFYIK